MIPGTALYRKEKTLFYAECKLGDLNANWIPILSVSIFASYNFTPLLLESVFQGYIKIKILVSIYQLTHFKIFRTKRV